METTQKQDLTHTIAPLVNIVETTGGVMLEAEMPGLEKEDIDLKLSGDELTITGTRRNCTAPQGYTVLYGERCPYAYRRSFTLSSEIAREGITAAYDRGVLTVTLPKSEAAKPRKIDIQA